MLFLSERGKKKLMDGYTVEFRDGSDPSSYNGKIVECSWDKEKKVWVSMRIRVDKTTPNDINTARKVSVLMKKQTYIYILTILFQKERKKIK